MCVPGRIANVYAIRGRDAWVLVDTSNRGAERGIMLASGSWLRADDAPSAILLTHGHADHSGSAAALADAWKVPVYAHAAELAFVRDGAPYPAPDLALGGFLATISRFLPREPVKLGDAVRPLDLALPLPGLEDWEIIETPGHSPGHVALYRSRDHVLIAGDACTTMDLDSFLAVAFKLPKVHRPPAPFTCDWEYARRSVEAMAALEPNVLGCGHGLPMAGPQVAGQLWELARHFPVPAGARYAREPFRTESVAAAPDGNSV
jgi:glyoxylase-like metal-dependent hydrolase (beta-lactamase superfamily II)